jgi:acetyl esterase/lipase
VTAIRHRDVTYLRRGDLELLARVYDADGPTVVEVHGGAWCDLDRRAGELYDTALAEAGYRVVAIDFRMGPDHRHPAASEDVAAAVDWARAELGAEQVALAGSSSGGHLALHAALQLDRPVAGVIALWPPTHPLDRFRYAATKDDDHGRRLVRNTLAYFGDEATMAEAAIARVVADGEATDLPPVFLVHPTEDANVPRHISEDLVAAYRSAGGEIQVWWVEGQPHAFGHFPGSATDELVERMVRTLSTWFGTAGCGLR